METILNEMHGGNGFLRLISRQPSNLVAERDAYRHANRQLALFRDLHRRLADKLNLTAMLEALSDWLSPHLGHELLALACEGDERVCQVCSSHGPDRQRLGQVAEYWLGRAEGMGRGVIRHEPDLYVILWRVEVGERRVRMAAVRRGVPEDVAAVQRLLDALVEEVSGSLQRALTFEEIYQQARQDKLTGLGNRYVFQERAEQEMGAAQRYGHPLTLAYLDLDYFKAINDRLGHGEGDRALRAVARALAGMVRESDLLVRLGGDEFVMLLPSTTLEQAEVLAERMCRAVAALDIQAPGYPPLGVSIGLAAHRANDTLLQWLERADAALYRAKAGGRARAAA